MQKQFNGEKNQYALKVAKINKLIVLLYSVMYTLIENHKLICLTF